MKELLDKRFLKALLLGGPLLVAGLVSLSVFIGVLGNKGLSLSAVVPLILGMLLLYAALWATGFWGKWGILFFFVLAPVVVLVDFSINPLAPLGSILFGGLCLYLFVDKNVLSKNS